MERPFQCSLENNGTTLYILLTFNSTYNITSYTINGRSIECEPCTPGVRCQCNAQEERMNVTLTAFNGATQVEPSSNLVVATCKPTYTMEPHE